MEWVLYLLAVIGFLLSGYAFYIDRKLKKNSSYKAVCDINDKMSCTKAFSSKHGKTFGVSNGIWGMLFYAVVFVLLLIRMSEFVFYLSILAVLGSVYLAFVLYTKVKDFCLVCNSIYLINILLLVFSYITFIK